MRVIEPRQLTNVRHKKSRAPALFIWVVFFAVTVSAGYGLVRMNSESSPRSDISSNNSANELEPTSSEQTKKTHPIQFSGSEFRDLYKRVMITYPNTQAFPVAPVIVGDDDVDEYIRAIAEARGFSETRMPVTALVKLNEPLFSGEKDDLLQPLAHEGWELLKAAAKKDGISLALLSAYRSPEFQRTLFLERLIESNGATMAQILRQQADSVIDVTLGRVALPGYSRHHTGYTIDLWCEDGSVTFERSSCFEWIRADNYSIAKEAGWIPSYPEGADDQGPEPEAWEYVWVGRDVLFE